MPGTPGAALDVVVEIDGFRKRFGEDVVAVDDLSFAVQRGQICGLLGPNGAGKTTTLRMLLGLIYPDAGSATVLGERTGPGAPVLRRMGTLIEQAAFVPHLSGLHNLELWWEAGGARMRDANLDEALAIAGLGGAIDRKVKTYSQGMRQRLGLARVLLGRPEVLVLDEPTNGLDPQEMHDVRMLLRRMSDAGATVLFSSHVLAEVEQTCTHAVVMDKGRLVASGTVSSLIGVAGSVYLEVDDGDAARRVLSSHAGVGTVTPEGGGLLVDLRGGTRADLVAALVRAGVGVETVMSRRRLEDAFLGLVEGGT
jgi:ABC-2 type transport system ATP-binding protein